MLRQPLLLLLFNETYTEFLFLSFLFFSALVFGNPHPSLVGFGYAGDLLTALPGAPSS